MNDEKIIELMMKPVKQRAFWKQIQADIAQGVENKMMNLSIAEIIALIEKQKVLCSFCGKEISFRMPMTSNELAIFVTFIINPLSGMTCNECYERCAKKGTIIASVGNLIKDDSTDNLGGQ